MKRHPIRRVRFLFAPLWGWAGTTLVNTPLGVHRMSVVGLIQYLHNQFDPPRIDGELLQQYVAFDDAGAFRDIVARHGPMVLRLCRRRLGEADGDDAFRPYFWSLQACQIDSPPRGIGRVAAWRGPAGVSKSQPRTQIRRSKREVSSKTGTSPDPATELTVRKLFDVLDEEVNRLPESDRLPLMLVYWQGLTYEKTARALSLSTAALHGRLQRGRKRLADRMNARGYSRDDFAPLLLVPLPTVILPIDLLTRTVAVGATGASVPAAVAAMIGASTGKFIPTIALTVLIASASIIGIAANGSWSTESNLPPNQPVQPRPVTQAVDRFGDPLPEGAIARLGSLRFPHEGVWDFAVVDNATAMSLSMDGSVRFWNLATGRTNHSVRLEKTSGGIGLPAVSPDGKTVAAKDGSDINIWAAETGRWLKHFRVAPAAYSIYGSRQTEKLSPSIPTCPM